MSQFPAPPPLGQPAPDHPQTTTILVLGICALVFCQVLGPFAWIMGNRALREIDDSGGRIGGRDTVNIGRVLGMVASVLLMLAAGFLVLMLVLFLVGAGMVVGIG